MVNYENVQESKPSPVQWLRLLEWSQEHRRIWCVEYEECLDRAILEHWSGWSCCSCEVRREWRPGEEYNDADLSSNSKKEDKDEQGTARIQGSDGRGDFRKDG